MVSTNASAVFGPDSRLGHQQPRLRMFLGRLLHRLVQLPICWFNISSSPSKSSRRHEAQGFNGSSRNNFCPAWLHSVAFFCIPLFMERCCSSFFTRLRISTSLCRCNTSCRRSRCSRSGVHNRGNRFSPPVSEYGPHPVCPSSACARNWLGFALHRRPRLRVPGPRPTRETTLTVPRGLSSGSDEWVYGPTGNKLALMLGQTFAGAWIPLPGGGYRLYHINNGTTDGYSSCRLAGQQPALDQRYARHCCMTQPTHLLARTM